MKLTAAQINSLYEITADGPEMMKVTKPKGNKNIVVKGVNPNFKWIVEPSGASIQFMRERTSKGNKRWVQVPLAAPTLTEAMASHGYTVNTPEGGDPEGYH